MNYCDALVRSIRQFNSLILQAHYMQGSTSVTKMTSVYFFRDVHDTLNKTPLLISNMPYSMLIVIKVPNVDVQEFLNWHHNHHFVKRIRSGKINHVGNADDKHFLNIMKRLEMWFDMRLKNDCPNCSMGVRERISDFGKDLDIGFTLSFPITIQISNGNNDNNNSTSRNSNHHHQVVDLRMVYLAGYSEDKIKGTRGIIQFPIISGPLLEWSFSKSGGSSDGEFDGDNNNNNSGSVSKVCCLLHYLWTREVITKGMLKSNICCFVRLLSINPSKINTDNIRNSRYIDIKHIYKNIGCDSGKSIYVQEFIESVKTILLL
uniref:Wsv267-like protein n=1 Tax=Litopenaeus vannamei majanivirus Nimav-1_LVa TaxID=2984273 RepID=A0A9C7BYV9_9VIRU|nr:MAG: wsv267-like protein [Litopenaeus vannamei majanivirus Nimav-1_LVa]